MKKEIRILMVEDSEDDVLLIMQELKKGDVELEFKRVDSHKTMKEALDDQTWDIIISDYSMPNFSGSNALELFKEKEIDIPFILVSGEIGEEAAVKMMKKGTHDYIMKDNLARLVPAIERELNEAEVRREKKRTDEKIIIAKEELEDLFESLMKTMINALDAKSSWTKGHSDRVAKLSEWIAKKMGLNDKEVKRLWLASILHDIGKIGTYDKILNKADKLTKNEYEIVKKHPVQGAKILANIKQLKDIIPSIKHHHERIDGKGYPDRLKGEDIPIFAKIIHVADTFDAIISPRPYRPSRLPEEAVFEIRKCSGTQFDPLVVDAFLKIYKNKTTFNRQ